MWVGTNIITAMPLFPTFKSKETKFGCMKTIQTWELQRSLREEVFRNQKLCWDFCLFIRGRCRSMRWRNDKTIPSQQMLTIDFCSISNTSSSPSKNKNGTKHTENISITETPKTISVSIEISYEQILDLALQLTKEDKEALMKALGDCLKEEVSKKEGNDSSPFSTNTPTKLKCGEYKPEPLTEEQIEQLEEANKKAWKDDDKTDEEWERLMQKHL